MNRLLIQGVCKPLDVIDQVLVIYAGTKGFLDKVPVNLVGKWEKEFISWFHETKQPLWDRIKGLDAKMGSEEMGQIEAAIEQFNEKFASLHAD